MQIASNTENKIENCSKIQIDNILYSFISGQKNHTALMVWDVNKGLKNNFQRGL